MTISTLTTEDVQEIYESAVHEEATGSDEANFVLECKLDDAGGTGATIRKLIDMVRARDVELLAVREAQPIGSFHIRDQQVEATTDYVKDGEWPIDNGEILVYSAPPAPEGFNKLNIRAAAQLRAAMRDQWLKAEDFADKIYWQNLHNIANEIVVALMAPTPTK